MAKRDNGGKGTNKTANSATSNAGATTDPMEQRLLAFAEQLGRIVGTVQAKTEGWLDRDALNKQITGVRDSATELLEQLKTTVTSAASGGNSAAADTAGPSPARSRGAVDAPGKKHRKPTPKDSRAVAARARASSLQSGKSSMKTMKRRGRG